MELKLVDLERAAGHLLAHNAVDEAGRKVLRKGTHIGADELAKLRELGQTEVWIAHLASDDIREDEVARRLTGAMAGQGIELSSLSTGRANLQATQKGILKVNVEALRGVNQIPGLAIATRSGNAVVTEGQVVATLKVIPYAMPRVDVERAEEVADRNGVIMFIRPFQSMRVGVVLIGDAASEDRLRRVYGVAIRERVGETGSEVVESQFVCEDVKVVADAIRQLITTGVDMIALAGETSIVDVDDVTPRAVKSIGGRIEIYGVPVDPGNLLMLAYVDEVPVVGAPGCVRSRTANVVDLVLPRLLAGEALTRDDIVELGHGGLMD